MRESKKILRDTAYELSDLYTRPPTRDGDYVQTIKFGDRDMYEVKVSRQPIADVGNNVHSGRWVIITSDYDRISEQRYIEIGYQEDGVAGNFDDVERYEVDEVTADDLVRYTKKKL